MIHYSHVSIKHEYAVPASFAGQTGRSCAVIDPMWRVVAAKAKKRRLSTMPAQEHFTAETQGHRTIIRFAPNLLLTGAIAQGVGEEMVNRIERQGCRRLVVNFANVAGLTSLMIAKLLVAYKQLQAVGGRIVLCEVPGVIREILDEVRVTKLIAIYPTEQEALANLP
jgi:stage II sporulation protein AA (anti-sigma F factor antagonist)